MEAPAGYQDAIDEYLKGRGKDERANYVGIEQYPLCWTIWRADSAEPLGVFEPKFALPGFAPVIGRYLTRGSLEAQLSEFFARHG